MKRLVPAPLKSADVGNLRLGRQKLSGPSFLAEVEAELRIEI